MPTYALFIWIILGALIGWKGLGLLGKSTGLSQIFDLGIGIVGGMAGGYLAALMGWGLIMSLVLAVLGSFALMYIAGMVKNRGK